MICGLTEKSKDPWWDKNDIKKDEETQPELKKEEMESEYNMKH